MLPSVSLFPFLLRCSTQENSGAIERRAIVLQHIDVRFNAFIHMTEYPNIRSL